MSKILNFPVVLIVVLIVFQNLNAKELKKKAINQNSLNKSELTYLKFNKAALPAGYQAVNLKRLNEDIYFIYDKNLNRKFIFNSSIAPMVFNGKQHQNSIANICKTTTNIKSNLIKMKGADKSSIEICQSTWLASKASVNYLYQVISNIGQSGLPVLFSFASKKPADSEDLNLIKHIYNEVSNASKVINTKKRLPAAEPNPSPSGANKFYLNDDTKNLLKQFKQEIGSCPFISDNPSTKENLTKLVRSVLNDLDAKAEKDAQNSSSCIKGVRDEQSDLIKSINNLPDSAFDESSCEYSAKETMISCTSFISFIEITKNEATNDLIPIKEFKICENEKDKDKKINCVKENCSNQIALDRQDCESRRNLTIKSRRNVNTFNEIKNSATSIARFLKNSSECAKKENVNIFSSSAQLGIETIAKIKSAKSNSSDSLAVLLIAEIANNFIENFNSGPNFKDLISKIDNVDLLNKTQCTQYYLDQNNNNCSQRIKLSDFKRTDTEAKSPAECKACKHIESIGRILTQDINIITKLFTSKTDNKDLKNTSISMNEYDAISKFYYAFTIPLTVDSTEGTTMLSLLEEKLNDKNSNNTVQKFIIQKTVEFLRSIQSDQEGINKDLKTSEEKMKSIISKGAIFHEFLQKNNFEPLNIIGSVLRYDLYEKIKSQAKEVNEKAPEAVKEKDKKAPVNEYAEYLEARMAAFEETDLEAEYDSFDAQKFDTAYNSFFQATQGSFNKLLDVKFNRYKDNFGLDQNDKARALDLLKLCVYNAGAFIYSKSNNSYRNVYNNIDDSSNLRSEYKDKCESVFHCIIPSFKGNQPEDFKNYQCNLYNSINYFKMILFRMINEKSGDGYNICNKK